MRVHPYNKALLGHSTQVKESRMGCPCHQKKTSGISTAPNLRRKLDPLDRYRAEESSEKSAVMGDDGGQAGRQSCCCSVEFLEKELEKPQ
jgi:hypothetical protein